MANEPKFDTDVAHKYFSAQCFNRAWDLIDKQERTSEEDEQMIKLSQASLWHWSQRKDCTKNNLAIGYWQASRVYALVGQADDARKYGQLSLDNCEENQPFFIGYAHEALARAESVTGNKDQMERHLEQAHKYANMVPKDDEKKILVDDLKTVLLK